MSLLNPNTYSEKTQPVIIHCVMLILKIRSGVILISPHLQEVSTPFTLLAP